jgi:hypothetical protein
MPSYMERPLMNTFLPYRSFEESARSLDNKRLGKQRVEVLQLLRAILDPNAKGWRNHPCSIMWRGYENSLIRYGVAVCDEWIGRGFKDTCREKIQAWEPLARSDDDPPWLGDEALHASHRANLLRKDPEYYGRHGWKEDPTMEYVWPSQSS